MKICKKFCEVYNTKTILCSQNGKKFVVNNPTKKKIDKCIVDGCWINGPTPRCDFLIKVEDEVLYLVELKGTDHIRALGQIVSTAEQLKVSAFGGERKSILVCAPSPKTSTKYQNAQLRLSRRYKNAGVSFPKKKIFAAKSPFSPALGWSQQYTSGEGIRMITVDVEYCDHFIRCFAHRQDKSCSRGRGAGNMARKRIDFGHVLHLASTRSRTVNTPVKRNHLATILALIGADHQNLGLVEALEPRPVEPIIEMVHLAGRRGHQRVRIEVTFGEGSDGFGKCSVVDGDGGVSWFQKEGALPLFRVI